MYTFRIIVFCFVLFLTLVDIASITPILSNKRFQFNKTSKTPILFSSVTGNIVARDELLNAYPSLYFYKQTNNFNYSFFFDEMPLTTGRET